MYSKELIRGTIIPMILRLLYPGRKMYGYEICQRVKELTNEDILVREGSLYPALHKLLDEGLIKAEEITVDNRSRRYYQLTSAGKVVAEESNNEFDKYVKSMQLFLKRTTA